MTTGEDLHGSNYVWRIQSILHEKAKQDPDFRFYTLSDKVWSLEFLWEADQRVGLNAGRVGLSWGWTERPSIPLRTMAWNDGWGNGRGTFRSSQTGEDRHTETGTSGEDPEETTGGLSTSGYSLYPGPGGLEPGAGGSDLGPACVGADL